MPQEGEREVPEADFRCAIPKTMVHLLPLSLHRNPIEAESGHPSNGRGRRAIPAREEERTR